MKGLEDTIAELTHRVEALLAANASLRTRLESEPRHVGAESPAEPEIVANIARPARDAERIENQRERLDELVREIDRCLAILNN